MITYLRNSAQYFALVFFPFLALAGSSESLDNPLALDSMDALFLALVNMVQIIATPIIVFFVIYSGFMIVTAQGNEEKLATAKKAFIYAIIGGVVIAGAEVISQIVANTANEFTN